MALTKARLILALHDAFQCGIEQGQDEATSYDWGSPPRISREEAFKELFEAYGQGYLWR